jgi:hypothetical protein
VKFSVKTGCRDVAGPRLFHAPVGITLSPGSSREANATKEASKEDDHMKRLAGSLAGGALLFLVVGAAWAVPTQPGGPFGSDVTVGEPITDDNDTTIDRCECDGGPLEEIVVHTDRDDEVVGLDRLNSQIAFTNDGVRVGRIVKVTNAAHEAIVIVIQLDEGLIGDLQRIAVRRTAFYYDDGAIIITTTMDDLQQSVLAGAEAAAGA